MAWLTFVIQQRTQYSRSHLTVGSRHCVLLLCTQLVVVEWLLPAHWAALPQAQPEGWGKHLSTLLHPHSTTSGIVHSVLASPNIGKIFISLRKFSWRPPRWSGGWNTETRCGDSGNLACFNMEKWRLWCNLMAAFQYLQGGKLRKWSDSRTCVIRGWQTMVRNWNGSPNQIEGKSSFTTGTVRKWNRLSRKVFHPWVFSRLD